MKIEPIEIEQDKRKDILVNVSGKDVVDIWQNSEYISIERAKIQELIDILEHEKSK